MYLNCKDRVLGRGGRYCQALAVTNQRQVVGIALLQRIIHPSIHPSFTRNDNATTL
jgi:hypothetical protein